MCVWREYDVHAANYFLCRCFHLEQSFKTAAGNAVVGMKASSRCRDISCRFFEENGVLVVVKTDRDVMRHVPTILYPSCMA